MNSPADIISKYLIDKNIGITDPSLDLENPIFVGQLPAQPNQCAGVFDTKSKTDGRLMNGTTIFHPGVSIIIRSKSYREVYNLMHEVKQALSAIKTTTVTLEGNEYVLSSISFTSDILSLGAETDKNRRQLMSINFKVTLKIT